MYNGYIIECPSMCDLFWKFVSIKYPDEPEELHEMSLKSLNKLNKHLTSINAYLKNISADDNIRFSDFDNFIDYVLDNYPSHIDRDVLDIYLNNLDGMVALISTSFHDDVVVLDRFGSTAIIME